MFLSSIARINGFFSQYESKNEVAGLFKQTVYKSTLRAYHPMGLVRPKITM